MNKVLLLLIVLGGLLVSSCNSFLDKEPDARAKVESLQDIKELLVNAYPQATYHLIGELMSDNVIDMGVGVASATSITNEEMYYWREGTSSDTDSPFATWTGFYAGIAVANHALRELDKLEETEEVRALRGEALLCRAFGHFFLVNLFAEHYDPATAGSALGIPYVTEPETVAVKQYTRNTMEETYLMIEQDLRRGINMIDDKIYDQPKFHFTKRAAHAFASRFYAYKGNEWEKVLYHANQAIPEDFAYEMRDMVAGKKLAQLEYMRQYTLPSQPAILLSVTVKTYWNDMYATCPPSASQYNLSPVELREIIPIISRMSVIENTWLYRREGIYGLTVGATMAKSYAYFRYEDLNSSRGMTYLNVPFLTVEDVAFNRIEAHIMLNDTISAIKDFNRYISMRANNYGEDDNLTVNRINDFYNAGGVGASQPALHPYYENQLTNTQMNMLKCLVNFRRMEFIQEGLRWFDIKRFHIEVRHYRHDDRDYSVLESHDLRRALQIPQEAWKVGVEPNQRPATED